MSPNSYVNRQAALGKVSITSANASGEGLSEANSEMAFFATENFKPAFKRDNDISLFELHEHSNT